MLSDRLKKLREQNQLTQVQFAKIFGISAGTIGMWETNKRSPDTEMLKKISEYFNVSLDYLLDNQAQNKKRDNDLKFALFNGADDITDEMLEEVKQYAEMVKLREESKKKKK